MARFIPGLQVFLLRKAKKRRARTARLARNRHRPGARLTQRRNAARDSTHPTRMRRAWTGRDGTPSAPAPSLQDPRPVVSTLAPTDSLPSRTLAHQATLTDTGRNAWHRVPRTPLPRRRLARRPSSRNGFAAGPTPALCTPTPRATPMDVRRIALQPAPPRRRPVRRTRAVSTQRSATITPPFGEGGCARGRTLVWPAQWPMSQHPTLRSNPRSRV